MILQQRTTRQHPEKKKKEIMEKKYDRICLFVCLMVFNATFNNISVISWQSVVLVEETRVPEVVCILISSTTQGKYYKNTNNILQYTKEKIKDRNTRNTMKTVGELSLLFMLCDLVYTL
jgi:hypothetical protein